MRHVPSRHELSPFAAAHRTPHAPQFLGSLDSIASHVLVSLPSQSALPAGQFCSRAAESCCGPAFAAFSAELASGTRDAQLSKPTRRPSTASEAEEAERGRLFTRATPASLRAPVVRRMRKLRLIGGVVKAARFDGRDQYWRRACCAVSECSRRGPPRTVKRGVRIGTQVAVRDGLVGQSRADAGQKPAEGSILLSPLQRLPPLQRLRSRPNLFFVPEIVPGLVARLE